MKNEYPKEFRNENKFQDDVWGEINLNHLECEAVDTPEFQRLFRTSQLGFVDLVYHSANHTRGTHSIGVCRAADMLVSHLLENTARGRDEDERYAPIEISPAERILIRLGALLHDISHVPLSHDLERKSHKVFFSRKPNADSKDQLKLGSCYGYYPKHDDYEANPLLYILLCDTEKSVLARVLEHYSTPFYKLLRMSKGITEHKHLQDFLSHVEAAAAIGWNPDQKLLPALLFHLLFYEDAQKEGHLFERRIAVEFGEKPKLETWGLGPPSLREELHKSWYQPFRHDVIGNTLSADLIDYLKRDPQRMGSDRRVDLHLLNYYVLVSPSPRPLPADDKSETAKQNTWYRCAIDLYDRKRGTPRVNLIDDIFRLLDLRHEIHQKAVLHRVVQSANAMLSRALFLLGSEMPTLAEIVGPGQAGHSLKSEDTLFSLLVDRCDAVMEGEKASNDARLNAREAKRIIFKLADRRVFRPLVIIPGDRAARHFQIARPTWSNAPHREYCLRTLATIVNSERYRPFLLFAATCVEKYLAGVFDSGKALCEYIRRIENEEAPPIIAAALTVAPSRVLFWAPPFKQLYKDPALVVSLSKTCVDRVDALAALDDPKNIDESVLERAQKAIADADSKYAALWALYVFVSDGLFYSGILNKLANNGSSSEGVEVHIQRLRDAQVFVVAALDAICRDWSEACEAADSATALQQKLSAVVDEAEFKSLLGMWMAMYKLSAHGRRNPVSRLSAVNVTHYAHGEPLTKPHGHKCRDVRYKFDSKATSAWESGEGETGTDKRELVDLLKLVGVKGPQLLSKLEFEQLVELYSTSREKCRDLRREAESGRTITSRDLRVLWTHGIPWPTEKKREASEYESIPRTARDIQRWLAREARILEPHVRSDFARGSKRIVSFIESVPEAERGRVLADLEERFLNESQLIWNNAKAGRVVQSLERKWRKQGFFDI